jgi:hypothetical protein
MLGADTPAVFSSDHQQAAEALPQRDELRATYRPQQQQYIHLAPLPGLVQGPDSRTAPSLVRVSTRLIPWVRFQQMLCLALLCRALPACM